MTTPRPAWVPEYGTTYEGIVASWGYTVEKFETFGYYQGDHLALLRDGGRIGLVVFGYGSCSGCDALEDVQPWSDDEDDDWQGVVDLADELRRSIHWADSHDALRAWIDANPQNHWWAYEDEVIGFLNATLGTHLESR